MAQDMRIHVSFGLPLAYADSFYLHGESLWNVLGIAQTVNSVDITAEMIQVALADPTRRERILAFARAFSHDGLELVDHGEVDPVAFLRVVQNQLGFHYQPGQPDAVFIREPALDPKQVFQELIEKPPVKRIIAHDPALQELPRYTVKENVFAWLDRLANLGRENPVDGFLSQEEIARVFSLYAPVDILNDTQRVSLAEEVILRTFGAETTVPTLLWHLQAALLQTQVSRLEAGLPQGDLTNSEPLFFEDYTRMLDLENRLGDLARASHAFHSKFQPLALPQPVLARFEAAHAHALKRANVLCLLTESTPPYPDDAQVFSELDQAWFDLLQSVFAADRDFYERAFAHARAALPEEERAALSWEDFRRRSFQGLGSLPIAKAFESLGRTLYADESRSLQTRQPVATPIKQIFMESLGQEWNQAVAGRMKPYETYVAGLLQKACGWRVYLKNYQHQILETRLASENEWENPDPPADFALFYRQNPGRTYLSDLAEDVLQQYDKAMEGFDETLAAALRQEARLTDKAITWLPVQEDVQGRLLPSGRKGLFRITLDSEKSLIQFTATQTAVSSPQVVAGQPVSTDNIAVSATLADIDALGNVDLSWNFKHDANYRRYQDDEEWVEEFLPLNPRSLQIVMEIQSNPLSPGKRRLNRISDSRFWFYPDRFRNP